VRPHFTVVALLVLIVTVLISFYIARIVTLVLWFKQRVHGRFPNPTRELPQGVGMREGWVRWLLGCWRRDAVAVNRRLGRREVKAAGIIIDLISQSPSSRGSQK
jgi:hypothetical protein